LVGQSTDVVKQRRVANDMTDQDEVPSASSTRAVARPMPSVNPVMPMTPWSSSCPGRRTGANRDRRL
jgi:hypothetical protein